MTQTFCKHGTFQCNAASSKTNKRVWQSVQKPRLWNPDIAKSPKQMTKFLYLISHARIYGHEMEMKNHRQFCSEIHHSSQNIYHFLSVGIVFVFSSVVLIDRTWALFYSVSLLLLLSGLGAITMDRTKIHRSKNAKGREIEKRWRWTLYFLVLFFKRCWKRSSRILNISCPRARPAAPSLSSSSPVRFLLEEQKIASRADLMKWMHIDRSRARSVCEHKNGSSLMHILSRLSLKIASSLFRFQIAHDVSPDLLSATNIPNMVP